MSTRLKPLRKYYFHLPRRIVESFVTFVYTFKYLNIYECEIKFHLKFLALIQKLSVSPVYPNSIWGSICKQAFLRNIPNKIQKLYFKWKNNSCNVQSIVKDAFDRSTNAVTFREKSPFGRHFELITKIF